MCYYVVTMGHRLYNKKSRLHHHVVGSTMTILCIQNLNLRLSDASTVACKLQLSLKVVVVI